jgi:hypothetical protein
MVERHCPNQSRFADANQIRGFLERIVHQAGSRESSNAGCQGNTSGRFRITHPFHPLRGAEYELVTRRLNWGEDRVFYYDQTGALKSFLSNVTDLVSEDAFTHVSAGRSAFRADDLLELLRLIDRYGRRNDTAKEV